MIEKRALGLGTIMQPLRTAIVLREFALLGVLVIFGIIMALASPAFLTKGNIEALLLGLSVEGTIAVGMVMVMIIGGFDLSVGSPLGSFAITRRTLCSAATGSRNVTAYIRAARNCSSTFAGS